jgi:hypothetical protein
VQKDVVINKYDYSTGFDHGFEKFNTNAQPSSNSNKREKEQPKPVQKNDDFFFNEAFNNPSSSSQN